MRPGDFVLPCNQKHGDLILYGNIEYPIKCSAGKKRRKGDCALHALCIEKY